MTVESKKIGETPFDIDWVVAQIRKTTGITDGILVNYEEKRIGVGMSKKSQKMHCFHYRTRLFVAHIPYKIGMVRQFTKRVAISNCAESMLIFVN